MVRGGAEAGGRMVRGGAEVGGRLGRAGGTGLGAPLPVPPGVLFLLAEQNKMFMISAFAYFLQYGNKNVTPGTYSIVLHSLSTVCCGFLRKFQDNLYRYLFNKR